MNEVASVLSAEQKAVEQQLIKDVLDAVNASFEVIARSLIQVKEQGLWIEYPSMNDWAFEHFRFEQREVDHYIMGYAVSQRLESVDNGGKPLKLTHALLVGKFDEEDQATVYQAAVNAANESGKKLTNNLIRETGRTMLENNKVKLRTGVKNLGQTGNSSLVKRVIKELPELEDEDKYQVFKAWIDFEEVSFLNVMKALIEEKLEEHDSE